MVACHEPLQHKKHPLGSNLQSNLCQTGGLADAGLTADGHGATADRPAFARTDASVLPTTERLKAAAGSAMLPQEQAHNLIEAFEVVQLLRTALPNRALRSFREAIGPARQGSVVADRSEHARPGRAEIAAVQRRMEIVAQTSPADAWASAADT